MKQIITIVDDEDTVLDVAKDAFEVEMIINRRRKQFKAQGDVSFIVDGVRYKRPPKVDVKRIAKNSKTQWIENQILGDLYQL